MPSTNNAFLSLAVSTVDAVLTSESAALEPLGVDRQLFCRWRVGHALINLDGAVTPGCHRFRRYHGLLAQLPAALEAWDGIFISRAQFGRYAELARRAPCAGDLPVGVRWMDAKTALDSGRALPQGDSRPSLARQPPGALIRRIALTWAAVLPGWEAVVSAFPRFHEFTGIDPGIGAVLIDHLNQRAVGLGWQRSDIGAVAMTDAFTATAIINRMVKPRGWIPRGSHILALAREDDSGLTRQLSGILDPDAAAGVIAAAPHGSDPLVPKERAA